MKPGEEHMHAGPSRPWLEPALDFMIKAGARHLEHRGAPWQDLRAGRPICSMAVPMHGHDVTRVEKQAPREASAVGPDRGARVHVRKTHLSTSNTCFKSTNGLKSRKKDCKSLQEEQFPADSAEEAQAAALKRAWLFIITRTRVSVCITSLFFTGGAPYLRRAAPRKVAPLTL